MSVKRGLQDGCHVVHQRSQCNNVHGIVIEHASQRSGITCTQVIKIKVRDFVTRDFINAARCSQEVFFEIFQSAAWQTVSPEPPCQGQQIEMRKILEGHGNVVQRVTCDQQWRVKCLAVKSDQCGARSQEIHQSFKKCGFLGWVPHKELCQVECIPLKSPHAYQEGVRTRPSRQAGGLGIQEGKRLDRDVVKTCVTRPLCDGG